MFNPKIIKVSLYILGAAITLDIIRDRWHGMGFGA